MRELIKKEQLANKKNYTSPIAEIVKSKENREELPCVYESDNPVLNYLKEILKPLYIEITSKDSKNILDLIQQGDLMGWCWETTQTCAIFFKHTDYVERGVLDIDERDSEYFHSWIAFNFNNKEYIFDPCLDCLCSKQLYYDRFNVKLEGKCSVMKIKKLIVDRIKNHTPNEIDLKHDWQKAWWNRLSDESKERYLQEVTIDSTEDVNAEIYRGSVGYRGKIKDDEVEEITAHYYMSGMI